MKDEKGKNSKIFLITPGKKVRGIIAPEHNLTIALFTCHTPNIFVVTKPSKLTIKV